MILNNFNNQDHWYFLVFLVINLIILNNSRSEQRLKWVLLKLRNIVLPSFPEYILKFSKKRPASRRGLLVTRDIVRKRAKKDISFIILHNLHMLSVPIRTVTMCVYCFCYQCRYKCIRIVGRRQESNSVNE